MQRRSFLRGLMVALILALFGFSMPRVEGEPVTDDGILYWVVVDGPNPFVFGVKNPAELVNFRRAKPEKFYDVKKARSACRDLSVPQSRVGTLVFA